jgi:SAM-dependent methyltransferase
VTYCDRFTVEEARAVINGLTDVPLTNVDRVLDLDTDGLSSFESETQDFSVLCNVLQLVANPIRVLGEAFRVVRPGGHVVLSVPDHRFAFEASRPVTPFEHVLDEYLKAVSVVTDAHFIDLLVLFYPSEVALGVSAVGPRLEQLRRRLEHAHVWDSMGFAELVKRGLRVVDVEATPVYEATGDDTRSECFVILRKDRQLID